MKNPLNLGIIVLVLVVLGCTCPQKLRELSNDSKTPSTSPSPFSTPTVSQPTPAKAGGYDLTMAKYNQISIGTSRADVERILGGKGTEVSNTTGGGVRFTVNKWEGDNYKSIILSFRDDKVMTRSQVALK